jgi:hypothetical protein
MFCVGLSCLTPGWIAGALCLNFGPNMVLLQNNIFIIGTLQNPFFDLKFLNLF